MEDSTMLQRFYKQLNYNQAELRKAKDEREELREDLEQTYNEVVAKRVQLREKDYDIEEIREEGERIQKDIDSLLGT